MTMFMHFIVLRIDSNQLSGCPIIRISFQTNKKIRKRSTLSIKENREETDLSSS